MGVLLTWCSGWATRGVFGWEVPPTVFLSVFVITLVGHARAKRVQRTMATRGGVGI